jgi:hypothetical protein
MLNLFVAMLLDAFRVFSLKTEDDDDGEDDKIKKLLSEIKIHMKNFFNEIKLKWSKNMRLFDSNKCTIKYIFLINFFLNLEFKNKNSSNNEKNKKNSDREECLPNFILK